MQLKPLPIQFLDAGYCTHPELVPMRNGRWNNMIFPSMFAVIEHPTEGIILFDTGYSMKFLEITRKFPERIYSLTTPVYLKPEDCADHKLSKLGISVTDVKHIVISHFHADHIGALGDFPKATYWFHEKAWRSVSKLGRWKGVFKGFLPDLIPSDFLQRTRPITSSDAIALPNSFAPFATGYDLLKDNRLIAVELPGHACGQLGLFVCSSRNQPFFLAADACWTSESYRKVIVPHPITKILFSSYREYQETLNKLQRFSQDHPEIVIAPSHCPEIHHNYCNRGPC